MKSSKAHHPGPGNYPRKPGVGMNAGARATQGTMQHDGIANCSDCKAKRGMGKSARAAAARSLGA